MKEVDVKYLQDSGYSLEMEDYSPSLFLMPWGDHLLGYMLPTQVSALDQVKWELEGAHGACAASGKSWNIGNISHRIWYHESSALPLLVHQVTLPSPPHPHPHPSPQVQFHSSGTSSVSVSGRLTTTADSDRLNSVEVLLIKEGVEMNLAQVYIFRGWRAAAGELLPVQRRQRAGSRFFNSEILLE